ncbi:Asp23/Gls24 family envelope stress response protein [Listeria sp. PSOL-1]|uniref:Asp23/Gls24 family envelope stress response protein n=1 Tax=Listeria sp. PSOL-1 TaxID=1844999 RepID=UPI0013D10D47|nr:Asp23/Gls24 family envelope stress response protein [Listeria sp. PSOL-1]
MVEESRQNGEQETHKNSLTFDDQVIKKITGIAAKEVDGVVDLQGGMISGITERFTSNGDITKGIDVEVGEKQAAIDLTAVVEYGRSIPGIFNEIVKKITEAVGRMTGLKVVEINLNVTDVKTRRELEEDNKKAKDTNDNRSN